jgi:uncharacterized metal-binding protein YceD (DUF177 family)
MDDFIIPFVGLSIGNHSFVFEINDAFFANIEYSELHKGQVKVEVNLDRQERMLVFVFNLQGSVHVTCDRCLGEFDHPIDCDERLIIKFGHEHREESDDVLVIPETDYQVDLAPLIYEYICVQLPIKLVHPMNAEGEYACDPDITRFISENPEHRDIDPRWNALRGLADNHKKEK